MNNLSPIIIHSTQQVDDRLFSFILKKRIFLKRSVEGLDDEDRINYAKSFIHSVIDGFEDYDCEPSDEANELGKYLKNFPFEWSTYLISTLYTSLLPDKYRSEKGIFYTPPVLVNRLLDALESKGIDWSQCKVIDPACGGGAFLIPVAARILQELKSESPEEIERHLQKNLKGIDVDPFGSWMTKKFLQLFLTCNFPNYDFNSEQIISCENSLELSSDQYEKFDLVIGNPPYGKVKLSEQERIKWSGSLYGHANYYGLFSDLAIRILKEKGILAYVMPSSFLGGKYFKKLRHLFLRKCPPFGADFISSREGVFPDVLQEVSLMYFQKGKCPRPSIDINFLTAFELDELKITPGGSHLIPMTDESPWILPRNLDQAALLNSIHKLPTRLKDLGYKVSTGPLVWNRHKNRLSHSGSKSNVPVVWAECVNTKNRGEFVYKCDGKNHFPYYEPYSPKDPNIIHQSLILVQRTTALEQSRRLVSAILPLDFVTKHTNGIAVENHLNMILPLPETCPAITMETINFLLNTEIIDSIFRCINGSTAVSAYEIEALPLPGLSDLIHIEELLNANQKKNAVELLTQLYL